MSSRRSQWASGPVRRRPADVGLDIASPRNSRVPSFKEFAPSSEAASRAKRANRRTDTKHEILLRSALWRRGLRYRKNVRSLPGKPDIVFLRQRVAVFCDGDFWHGRNWPALHTYLQGRTNASYWIAKIHSNMERDLRITGELTQLGWRVIRLWEGDIRADPEAAAATIMLAIKSDDAAAGRSG